MRKERILGLDHQEYMFCPLDRIAHCGLATKSVKPKSESSTVGTCNIHAIQVVPSEPESKTRKCVVPVRHACTYMDIHEDECT